MIITPDNINSVKIDGEINPSVLFYKQYDDYIHFTDIKGYYINIYTFRYLTMSEILHKILVNYKYVIYFNFEYAYIGDACIYCKDIDTARKEFKKIINLVLQYDSKNVLNDRIVTLKDEYCQAFIDASALLGNFRTDYVWYMYINKYIDIYNRTEIPSTRYEELEMSYDEYNKAKSALEYIYDDMQATSLIYHL